MTEPVKPAVAMIHARIQELDAIEAKVRSDLNTVGGSEQVAKWKAKTIPLLAQQVGPKEAQRFADTHPGPSFTSDLLEEFGDEVELYRSVLLAIAEQLKKAG